MKRILALALMVAFLGLALAPTVALAQKDKRISRVDPEIRLAQNALTTAKNKLLRAIVDEEKSEKSKPQKRVIAKLKAAITAVENAIALTREAQKLDDGKE